MDEQEERHLHFQGGRRGKERKGEERNGEEERGGGEGQAKEGVMRSSFSMRCLFR